MSLLSSRAWHFKTSHALQFDRLERRIALTAVGDLGASATLDAPDGGLSDGGSQASLSVLTVALADPAPGSLLASTPQQVSLVFNHAIIPDSLNDGYDIMIVQTDPEGDFTWATNPDSYILDDTSTQLSADLTDPLNPGIYQVWISGDTGIADNDGNFLSPDGTMLFLGGFEVVQPGVTLSQATDLASLGTTPLIVHGALDFSADPRAVSLYAFQLDPGHFWRLGLEVTTQRDGGSLDTALSLFDRQGNVLASDDVGRFDALKDPFLFAGLQPGTYYVGVSGTGNVAGTPGGYDPATGKPGTSPQAQAGGPFMLHLVADPVDTPPEVISFGLDHAEPSDPAPTGLSLGFSRVIAQPGPTGQLASALSRSIEVVGRDGREWPVQASTYDEAHARISYLFDEFLPPGHYVVKLPDKGGLLDLAGLPPVASGQPPGVLGQFDVAARQPKLDPHDLGALLPDVAIAGVSLDVAISPGQSVDYQFVATVPGMYKFSRQPGSDPASIDLLGPDGSRLLNPSGSNDTQLGPGDYTLRFSNPGLEPTHVPLFFRLAQDTTEIVLSNGVGQGPALSLRLISISSPSLVLPADASQEVASGPLPIASTGPPSRDTADSPAGGLTALPVNSSSSPGYRVSSLLPTTPSGGVSLMGWATDLVGRPRGAAPGDQAFTPESAPDGPAQVSGGVSLGQALAVSPRLPGSRPGWESFANPILGEVPASYLSHAAVIDLDLRQAIAATIRLRQWAIGQGTFLSDWVESWPSWPSGSSSPDPLIAQFTRGRSPVHGSQDSNGRRGAEAHERPDDASSSSGLLSPPILVLSVAALAQLCWHAARWWTSRRRLRPGMPKSAGRRSLRFMALDRIVSGIRVTPVAVPILRRPRDR
jgi:hypothetical protein